MGAGQKNVEKYGAIMTSRCVSNNMNIKHELMNVLHLMDDFVFRDRRIADHGSVRMDLNMGLSSLVGPLLLTKPGVPKAPKPEAPPLLNFLLAFGKEFIEGGLKGTFLSSTLPKGLREKSSGINSLVVVPIVLSDRTVGVLTACSRDKGMFSKTDLPRFRVLGAIVAYEMMCLERRVAEATELSRQLGKVLRSAREELKLTQDDLARRVRTSRIALSRWEAGGQPPSRALLRRWAEALGLLAGGRSEIITVVDATTHLIEMLREEPRRLDQLSPERFEVVVAERLDRMGYAVQKTGTATLRDGGIDIIAVSKSGGLARFLLAVQVKHHEGRRSTGRDAVDRLLAWQNTAFRLGLLVTNTRFTRDAIWAASQDPARHFLRLRDFTDLTRWLYDVFDSDFDWCEIPDLVEVAPGVSIHVPKPRFTEAGIVWPIKF